MNKNDVSQFLSSFDLEKQESLNEDLLERFVPKNKFNTTNRPLSSFQELMVWTEDNFKSSLKDQVNLNKFVHNRIIVDGQFVSFAEENDLSIECLYKDSVISWNTENNYEKYFVQGVFLVKSKNLEFIHAALFHKGNSNEDEISFFVIVSKKNYSNYIALRNKFDAWVQQRDRSNLHIKVIDGEDLPYAKDCTWEDLFLPPQMKKEIKSIVENFLASKDFYLQNKIPWKRGVLLYGQPGNGKTSLIRTLMSEYNFKPVTIVAEANNESVREAFSYAEEQSPSLLYFEDLDSLLEKSVDTSTFLNLMDGISAKNGLFVVATANEIKKLKANITNRPSRFDRKFEIPLPNQEMCYIYLKKWFGNIISPAKYKELSSYAEKYKFSYGYLKELYISSMFEALSHNRKIPNMKDIDCALKCLIKDKNLLNNGKSIDTDKYFK